jgi:hypothetical protein
MLLVGGTITHYQQEGGNLSVKRRHPVIGSQGV